jgi:hypothetical protein
MVIAWRAIAPSTGHRQATSTLPQTDRLHPKALVCLATRLKTHPEQPQPRQKRCQPIQPARGLAPWPVVDLIWIVARRSDRSPAAEPALPDRAADTQLSAAPPRAMTVPAPAHQTQRTPPVPWNLPDTYRQRMFQIRSKQQALQLTID